MYILVLAKKACTSPGHNLGKVRQDESGWHIQYNGLSPFAHQHPARRHLKGHKSETIQIQSHPAGNEKQHAVETAMTLQDHIDRHKKRNSSQPAAQRKRDRNKYGPVAKQNQEKHLLWEIQSAAVGKDNETICAQDLSLRNPKWSLNITSVAPATSRTLPIGWREAGKSQMLANLILYLLQYASCDQARRTMHLSTSWFLIPRCYRASQS